jgi:hypothetical protein
MFGKQNYQAVELVELSPTSVLWFLKGQLVFSISLQNNSSWIGVNVIMYFTLVQLFTVATEKDVQQIFFPFLMSNTL